MTSRIRNVSRTWEVKRGMPEMGVATDDNQALKHPVLGGHNHH